MKMYNEKEELICYEYGDYITQEVLDSIIKFFDDNKREIYKSPCQHIEDADQRFLEYNIRMLGYSMRVDVHFVRLIQYRNEIMKPYLIGINNMPNLYLVNLN